MINVKTYKNYWQDMVNRLSDLKESVLVANEAQLKEKIDDLDDFPVLVATIPSADGKATDVDNKKEVTNCLIFILKKVAASDRTDDSYIDDMQLMQQMIEEIEDKMEADKTDCDSSWHDLLKHLDVASYHIDPEFNYLGCDGWSLSFRM